MSCLPDGTLYPSNNPNPPATAAAALNGSGSTTFLFTVGPSTLGAIINLTGTSDVTFTETGTTTAIGVLAGDITPYSTLSPENLAQAVIEASYTTPSLPTRRMSLEITGTNGGSDPHTRTD